MNITKVDVVDPRMEGKFYDPFIELTVDEEVDETSDPSASETNPSYRIIPCGPFWDAEIYDARRKQWVNWHGHRNFDIGEMNQLRIAREQLVQIHVIQPDRDDWLFMPVQRARRLLRNRYKGRFSWRVIVDVEAALLGALKWRVEHSEPMCYGGAVPFDDRCLRVPLNTIVTRSTHLPLCEVHLAEYGATQKNSRV